MTRSQAGAKGEGTPVDEKTRQEIALHRWAVIAEAATALAGSERGAVVRPIAAREHAHPDGTSARYSRGTSTAGCGRAKAEWTGFALAAVGYRGGAGDAGAVRRGCALRLEMPGRSAAQIASILHYRHGVRVAERTVRGQLRRAGLHRAALNAAPKLTAVTRRTAERALGQRCSGRPVCAVPETSGSVRARLFLIVDDHSRLLVGRAVLRPRERPRLPGAAAPRHHEKGHTGHFVL